MASSAHTQTRSFRFVFRFSLLTALTLAGSLALALIAGNLLNESFNVHMSGLASALLALPIVLLLVFGGGALWSYGVAWMTVGSTETVTRSGALTYGAAVLSTGIGLELVFGIISALGRFVSLPIHVAFTVVFVPAAGVIAAVCTRKMVGMLGKDDLKSAMGRTSGLAASLGFLIVNLVMLALGWKVGAPGAAERFTMITVMLTSNAGAALAGGAAMGWLLERSSSSPSLNTWMSHER